MFVCSQVLNIDPPDSVLILRSPSKLTIHQEDLSLIDLRLRENPESSRPLNLDRGENLGESVGVVLDIDFTENRTEEGRPEYHSPPQPLIDVLLSVHLSIRYIVPDLSVFTARNLPSA